ncbi:hypothetical protein U9M48_001092 [Paspalum notatum var. saurae]|uniref:Uncharacterized protein n=1 Tax=Paspalum notatum var. saurae TaxID=547442 RepID=A0AAQ3SCR0_PASNO
MGHLPFRYLGIPMNHKKLESCGRSFPKKLSGWKGKLLSYGGRLVLVLINSVLSSLAMFMMSFFEVPKGILKKLDFYRSNFFWQGDNHKKKYRLIKWEILCLPKDQGGLGIKNLEIQNVCLLSKWLYKFINEEGVWQELLKNKYLQGKTIGEVHWKSGDSHFWSGLMKVKDRFLEPSTFNLHDGSQIRFWEDRWFGDQPLKHQYPSLYNITRKKHISVADVFSTTPLNISFRRTLHGDNHFKWEDLVQKIAFVQLDDQLDSIKWNLKKHGLFTVNSMYGYLGVILTKDNLVKRHWSGDARCHYQGNLLSKVLEHSPKQGKQNDRLEGLPLSGDFSYGGLRQAWVAIALED